MQRMSGHAHDVARLFTIQSVPVLGTYPMHPTHQKQLRAHRVDTHRGDDIVQGQRRLRGAHAHRHGHGQRHGLLCGGTGVTDGYGTSHRRQVGRGVERLERGAGVIGGVSARGSRAGHDLAKHSRSAGSIALCAIDRIHRNRHADRGAGARGAGEGAEWVCEGSGTWEGCRVMVPVPVATIDEVGAPDTVPT